MFQVAKLMLQTCPITVLVFLKPHIERLGFKKKKCMTKFLVQCKLMILLDQGPGW